MRRNCCGKPRPGGRALNRAAHCRCPRPQSGGSRSQPIARSGCGPPRCGLRNQTLDRHQSWGLAPRQPRMRRFHLREIAASPQAKAKAQQQRGQGKAHRGKGFHKFTLPPLPPPPPLGKHAGIFFSLAVHLGLNTPALFAPHPKGLN